MNYKAWVGIIFAMFGTWLFTLTTLAGYTSIYKNITEKNNSRNMANMRHNTHEEHINEQRIIKLEHQITLLQSEINSNCQGNLSTDFCQKQELKLNQKNNALKNAKNNNINGISVNNLGNKMQQDQNEYMYALYIPLISLAITLVCFWFGYTGTGDFVIGFFINIRKPTIIEQSQLEQMAERFINDINSRFTRKFNERVRISISENHTLNAFAYGKDNIILNTGLIEGSTVEVIHAVLAHEFGHLYNRDTNLCMTRVWTIMPLQIMSRFYEKFYTTYQKELSRYKFRKIFNRHTKLSTKGVLTGMVCLMCLPAIIGALFGTPFWWISSFIQKISSKSQEREADLFACRLGHANGLFSFVQYAAKSENSVNEGGLFSAMFESHPSPRVRMGYIEQFRRGIIQ